MYKHYTKSQESQPPWKPEMNERMNHRDIDSICLAKYRLNGHLPSGNFNIYHCIVQWMQWIYNGKPHEQWLNN